jgi:hypothetical protein
LVVNADLDLLWVGVLPLSTDVTDDTELTEEVEPDGVVLPDSEDEEPERGFPETDASERARECERIARCVEGARDDTGGDAGREEEAYEENDNIEDVEDESEVCTVAAAAAAAAAVAA